MSPQYIHKVQSRAPLRISFAGGGTELPPFISKYGGLVINSTISRFAHASVERLPEDNYIHFSADDLGQESTCTIQEIVAGNLDWAQTPLKLHKAAVNEFLNFFNLQPLSGLAIRTSCDAPIGSGLGSSSTLMVAILSSLCHFFGKSLSEHELAQLAFQVERKKLGLAGGLQDHYSSAFGGMNYIDFKENGEVVVNSLRLRAEHKAEFESWLVMIYTGLSRKTGTVIENQIRDISNSVPETISRLLKIKEYARICKDLIISRSFQQLGEVMHDAWLEKRSISLGMSTHEIDKLYEEARRLGAIGGKLSGAGGGGYLLLMCDPDRRALLKRTIKKEFNLDCESFSLVDERVLTWESNNT